MLRLWLIALFLSLTSATWSQVYTDSEEANSPPAAVGAPGRYYLNTGPTGNPNTVEVGRPYPYYPSYFPADAALGTAPPPAGKVKK
jgi:hypothetical protein